MVGLKQKRARDGRGGAMAECVELCVFRLSHDSARCLAHRCPFACEDCTNRAAWIAVASTLCALHVALAAWTALLSRLPAPSKATSKRLPRRDTREVSLGIVTLRLSA